MTATATAQIPTYVLAVVDRRPVAGKAGQSGSALVDDAMKSSTHKRWTRSHTNRRGSNIQI